MPPKPGGAKRVGGGAKRGPGAAKAGAKKGGAKAKGGHRAGGPIGVNARTQHLMGGSTMDLIRPVSDNMVGNQFVREEYRRNSGHVGGTSSIAMSALGQHAGAAPPPTSRDYGRQRSYSAATNHVSEIGKSMTNLFLAGEERPAQNMARFDGSSLNLTRNPNSLSAMSAATNLTRNPNSLSAMSATTNFTTMNKNLDTNIGTDKHTDKQLSPSKMASKLGKSLTNLLSGDKQAPTNTNMPQHAPTNPPLKHGRQRSNSGDSEPPSQNSRGSPVKQNISNIKSNLLGVTSNLLGMAGSRSNLSRSTGCLNLVDVGVGAPQGSNTDLRRSHSNVEISQVDEELQVPQLQLPIKYSRLKTFVGSWSNLSPIESMGSITSSKLQKHDVGGASKKRGPFSKFLPARLQNTIGGTALTSATPTAFSSHMDARMLQAASGMAGAGFVAAQLPNHEEGAELPDLSPDKIMDGSTIAHHPEQLEGLTAGEPPHYLTGEGEEERIPSDLMKATTIGENLYTKNQSYESPEHYQLSTPLLEQQPTFPLYQPHHVSYYSQNPEPLKYNYNDALQNYGTRPTHNDGMYCYSCVMFLGVLMIGIGIICVIVKLFRLFAGTIPLAIIGGCVLLVGILTLAGAMLAWRRKRTAIKKKNAHV